MENSGPIYIGAKGHRQVRTKLLTVQVEEKISYEDGNQLGRFEQSVIEDDVENGIADERQDQHLAAVILNRIRARLPGRIQRLTVKVTDNAVMLTGQCSTYYTKQLAQHVAMGVLDYQRLVNNISVRSLR